MRTREELEGEILSIAKKISLSLSNGAMECLAQLDLSMAQVRTLHLIAKDEPLVIGQLAQDLGVGQSTAGHLVDRLVKVGLVQRTEDPEDRRRTVVSLTAAGHDLHGRFRVNFELIREYIKDLSEEDLRCLHRGIEALDRAAAKKR